MVDDSLSPLWKTTRVPIELDHYSHSQDESFRRCPLKWYRQHYLRLKPIKPPSKPSRGRAIHKALEAFYSLPVKSRHPQIMFEVLETWLDPNAYLDEEEQEKDRKICAAALEAYWGVYGKDESIPSPKTELELSANLPIVDIPFTARLDILCLGTEHPFVLDFKTGEGDLIQDQIAYNVQLSRYLWLLHQNGHTQVKDIVTQAIKLPRSEKGKVELARHRHTPGKREIAYAVHDLAMMVKEIDREDRLIYPVYNKSCSFSCDYSDLCYVTKLGGDPQPVLEEGFYVEGGS